MNATTALIWVVIVAIVIGFGFYACDRYNTRHIRRFQRTLNDVLGGP